MTDNNRGLRYYTNGNGRWLSFGASAAVLIAAIGSVFYVAFQGQSNYNSTMRLQATVDAQGDTIRALKVEIAQQQQALGEIETQFCAQDVVRNLMHAQDLRTSSMLWEKVFNNKFPTDNSYYPTICNRTHTGTLVAPRP